MEILKYFCKTCGGDLFKKDEGLYVCQNCQNEYAAEVAEEHIDRMRRLFDETKLEAVANSRKNLYEAANAEYISNIRVHECCAVLKQYLPDDFQANFYDTAIGSDGRQIARFIRGIDVEANADYMEGAIRFLIRSLQSEYIGQTQEVIERTFKNVNLTKYEEYSTALSEEARKLDDCIYMTAYPRDVFVAYSSKDMDKVWELVEYLEEQGLSCFVAARNLRHGKGAVENYERALQEAMDNCTSFVFVSTPNSRHVGCDALKKEIPYIKRKDREMAPPEYQNDYARMPHQFKRHRVEYRLRESTRLMAADRIVADFFDGYERVYSPEEVAERVLNAEMDYAAPVVEEPIIEEPKFSVGKMKYCVGCKTECPDSAKFCFECGGSKFAESLKEVELLKKIEKLEKDRIENLNGSHAKVSSTSHAVDRQTSSVKLRDILHEYSYEKQPEKPRDIPREPAQTALSKENKEDNGRVVLVGVGDAGLNMVDKISGCHRVKINSQLGLHRDVDILIDADAVAGKNGISDDNIADINAGIAESKIVIACAGLGGQTGSNIAPVVVDLAKNQNKTVVAILCRPFRFEGRRRTEMADKSVEQMRGIADCVICISNELIKNTCDRRITLEEGFSMADAIVEEVVDVISATVDRDSSGVSVETIVNKIKEKIQQSEIIEAIY